MEPWIVIGGGVLACILFTQMRTVVLGLIISVCGALYYQQMPPRDQERVAECVHTYKKRVIRAWSELSRA